MRGLSSQISVAIPKTFRVGTLLDFISLIQDRAVDMLQNLCSSVAVNRTWAGKGLLTANLRVV